MATIIRNAGEGQTPELIDSFYLHYKEGNDDVYELVRINEHPSVELDLEWQGFPKTEASNS